MSELVWIMLGGALGTSLRYGVGRLLDIKLRDGIPLCTVTVNVVGCLVFGLVWALVRERLPIDEMVGRVLLTGFMGGFTTFSSFIFETESLLIDGRWKLAAANIVLQILAGLLALALGLKLGGLVTGT